MNASPGRTSAIAMAASDPGVPTTATRQPGNRAVSESIATRRWRPDRSSRIRLGGAGIDHLRRPAFEHEQRPQLAPDVVVAAIEPVHERGGGVRVEHAAATDALGR